MVYPMIDFDIKGIHMKAHDKEKEFEEGLRLIVIGRGETRGRRPHLVRIRESLYKELNEVAGGQFYLLVETALRRMIDDLKTRPISPVEIIKAETMDASREDERLVEAFMPRSIRSKKATDVVKLGAQKRTRTSTKIG